MEYCTTLVKETDYNSYLLCLLYPQPQRSACLSILAFDQELTSVKKQCRGNVLAGRMRFQWWRGLIDDIYTNAKDPSIVIDSAALHHPVAGCIADSVKRYSLTRRWFDKLIEVTNMKYQVLLVRICFLNLPVFDVNRIARVI